MTNKLPWIILSAVAAASVAFAPIACGGSSSTTGSGGSGGTGGTSSSSPASSPASSGPSSSSSSGGPDCSGFFNPGMCDDCAEASCCQETADCGADTDCQDCAAGTAQAGNDCTMGLWATLRGCLASKCDSDCLIHDECNPVTSTECSGAGAACDLAFGLGGESAFVCFPSGNVGACGAGCDNGNGPFCQAHFHCNDATSKCERYCCVDSDCGPAGNKCDKTPLPAGSTVGLCAVADPDAGAGDPCTAPVTPPTGACFMLTP